MSDKNISKSTLKEAKEQFEEIQKFALEEATKTLKEDVSKKVIELMNSTLEDEALNEEITIDADGTKIVIDDNGEIKVNPGQSENDFSSEENEEEEDNEEIFVSDEDDEIEIDNSEIDEMIEEMNFEEQEAAMPAPAPEAAAPVAPEAEMEMAPEAEPAAETMANPFQALMDKMDQMMSMMGGGESAGDEIEIIDDTEAAAPAPEAAPAPAPAPAPVAEEITFEVVNNEMELPENEDDILEIVGDDVEMDVEDTMDEMLGVGHNLRHSNRLAILPRQGVEHRKEMNENKAQYEAKLAELIKENESLKLEREELEAELVKFENGFIKLQENFGQMQDYNAKLVMAYKVAMSGGLTTDEKVQISEQFDKCDTVEDAEKLYKSIVSEHKIKVNKNPEKSIKSTSIKSTPVKSVSQPLYESREVSRMKQLAGIKKTEN